MNKKYYACYVLVNNDVICAEVVAENSELALNKAQGAVNIKEGWVHLNSTQGDSIRIKYDAIVYIKIEGGDEYE